MNSIYNVHLHSTPKHLPVTVHRGRLTVTWPLDRTFTTRPAQLYTGARKN